MTLVLLVVAGLLMQTLYRLRYADVGFRPDRVLTLRTSLPAGQVRHPRASHGVLRRRARARRAACPVWSPPATRRRCRWRGRAPRPASSSKGARRILRSSTTPTTGRSAPTICGRLASRCSRAATSTTSDQATAQPVVIVNQAMARRYWPGEDAVGKRIRTTDGPASVPWLTIVGVVGDVRQMGLDAPVRPEMYVPYRQFDSQPWFAPRDLVVRAAGDPTALVGSITREIHAVDPALPVSNVKLLNDILDEDVASRRIGTIVLIAFAAFCGAARRGRHLRRDLVLRRAAHPGNRCAARARCADARHPDARRRQGRHVDAGRRRGLGRLPPSRRRASCRACCTVSRASIRPRSYSRACCSCSWP